MKAYKHVVVLDALAVAALLVGGGGGFGYGGGFWG